VSGQSCLASLIRVYFVFVAIKYNVDNVKAYYRKAAALKAMKLYEPALQSAEQGRRHATNRRHEK